VTHKPSNIKPRRKEHTPVIPALRLRQEDNEFKANLGFMARLCLKKKKKNLEGNSTEQSNHHLRRLTPRLLESPFFSSRGGC
jgi:hypothetical protein